MDDKVLHFGCSTTSHMDRLDIAKAAITALNSAVVDPCGLLEHSTDFICGTRELTNDATLQALVQPPGDMVRFGEMMAAVTATITVRQRQYKKYLAIDVTALLAEETRWARSHNIDAEEVMGMFSPLKKKAPNATICFLASKMMAVKNRTVDYLDSMTTERRENVIKFAITHGRRQWQQKSSKQSVLHAEMKRIAAKKDQKATEETKQLETELKTGRVQDIMTRTASSHW